VRCEDIFDNSAGAKWPDAGRLCAADMKTRELYSAKTGTLSSQGIYRRLLFGKDQKKLALDKGYKWVGS
jgi:hypothetical protein